MSANPFLSRVLGEAEEPPVAPREPVDQADAVPPVPKNGTELDASPEPAEEVNLTAQELARMWQDGQQMDVATQLMFTEASYVDLVDFAFIVGQSEGRKLGRLLDELADSENIPVPEADGDYSSILQRVAATHGGRTYTPPVQ